MIADTFPLEPGHTDVYLTGGMSVSVAHDVIPELEHAIRSGQGYAIRFQGETTLINPAHIIAARHLPKENN